MVNYSGFDFIRTEINVMVDNNSKEREIHKERKIQSYKDMYSMLFGRINNGHNTEERRII